MKPVSLADITYEQGLQLIVLRKQALDSGKVRRMPKEALDSNYPLHAIGTQVLEKVAEGGFMDGIGKSLSSGLSGAKDWFGKLDPTVKSTLIGGGLGAGTGLAASAMNRDRHWLRNALMGGVAGSAIGGGIGVARNPGAADKIRDKLTGFAESFNNKDAPKPTAEAAPGGGSPTPAPLEDKSVAGRARQLVDADPETSASQIDSLRTDAESWAPESVHGTGAAGTVGATGYALRKLQQMKGYDPDAMLTHLGQMADDTPNLPRKLDSIGIRTMDQTNEALRGLGPIATQPGRDAALWRQFRANPQDPALRKQIEKLLAARGIKRNLMGGVAAKGSPALKNFLAGSGDDALETVLSKGFSGRRPVRGGAAGLLVGASGLGLKGLWDSYKSQQAHRTDAKNVLDAVRAELAKRNAAGG